MDNATWLSTSIIVVSSSKCVLTTMATLGSDICLVVILGFLASISTTYTLKNLVLFSTIDLTSKYR